MTISRRVRACIVTLLVSSLPATASAQEVVTTFEALQQVLAPGDTIYVTDPAGATIKGTLGALSSAVLELRVQRDPLVPSLRLLERDVNNIARRRHDPLWNGMLIGLAAGAVPVGVIFLASGEPFGADDAAPILGFGGIGLVTGLLIDLFNTGRVTIYVRAPRVQVAFRF